MPNRMKTAAAVALLTTTGLAASAMGQCTIYRLDMPDFDQRRGGLPGDGDMYCLPTATANALAYMSNNGYPDVFGGPRDWQSQAHYDDVTGQLVVMGFLMGTDPDTGTGMSGWLSATKAFVNSAGYTIVGSKHAKGFVGINPHQMADQMRIGGLVLPLVGWYDAVGSGRWRRDGGHMLTMWGGLNTCGEPADMILAYRDPWTGDSVHQQSAFSFVWTNLDADPSWTFKREGESSYWPRSVVRLASNDGFLDGFGMIWPLNGLTSDPITDAIQIVIPDPPKGGFGLEDFPEHPLTPGARLIAAGTGTLPTEGFVLSKPEAGTIASLHKVHFLDDEATLVAEITNASGMVVGRDGDVFVSAGLVLRHYELQADGSYAMTETARLPASADAMYYNDTVDEVVILNTTARRLMRVGQDMAIRRNDPIPAGVDLVGEASVAYNAADETEWIACSGSPELSSLVLDRVAGTLELVDQATLPGVAAPRSIQFGDDGTMFVGESGLIKAFEPGTRGTWVANPDSPMDGVESGPIFRVARGRTNYDPATMDSINVVPSEVLPGEPDCRADLDLDGALTIFDFLAFQNLFDSGSTWADFDHDGSLTIFDFLAFQNTFDAGC